MLFRLFRLVFIVGDKNNINVPISFYNYHKRISPFIVLISWFCLNQETLFFHCITDEEHILTGNFIYLHPSKFVAWISFHPDANIHFCIREVIPATIAAPKYGRCNKPHCSGSIGGWPFINVVNPGIVLKWINPIYRIKVALTLWIFFSFCRYFQSVF